MDTLETLAAWTASLEVRQVGGRRTITGIFPYVKTAVLMDRGRVRKERFGKRAFRYAIDENKDAKIDLLVGHDFGKPVASRQSGTLELIDSDDAVSFTAQLPNDPPSWVVDVEKAIAAGIMVGLSPGFRVPPPGVVPNAEEIIPEPGNETVAIRQINDAVLREFSVVTSGAYADAGVDLRSGKRVKTRQTARKGDVVAVTLTQAELAAALRLSDSPEELAESTRILSYVTTAIAKHSADAPDAISNEAAVRLGSYLYDQPTAAQGSGYANALRNSGAAAILLPYRIHRAGLTDSETVAAAQDAVGTVENPVVSVVINGTILTVTFADGTVHTDTLPSGGEGGGGVDPDGAR